WRGEKNGKNGDTHWLNYVKYQIFDGTGDDQSPHELVKESYTVTNWGTTTKPTPSASEMMVYSYTFHDSTEQAVKVKTITLPVVTSGQNGSGVASVTQQYY